MRDPVFRRLAILASLALFCWVIYLLNPVVIPFLIAFLLAYLFSPVVAKLQQFGLPRWAGISLIYIGITVLIGLITWFIVPIIWNQLIYARDHIPDLIRWLNKEFLPYVSHKFNIETTKISLDKASDTAKAYFQENYNANSVQDLILNLARSGLNFIQIGGTAVLVPIVAFYFMLDWEKMLARMQNLIPRQYEAKTVQVVQECHQVLGAFVKGQFLVMLLLGIVYGVGLQFIGLNVGLTIGIIAGLASIIPYLGFVVGIIAAIVATFLQFGMDWTQLILVGVVFMVGQAVEGYILQPFLLGDKIGLPPVAVVFAVLAGAQLFGFAGMLLALPVAAVLVVLLKHAVESYQNSTLYRSHSETLSVPLVELDSSEQNLQDNVFSEHFADDDLKVDDSDLKIDDSDVKEK